MKLFFDNFRATQAEFLALAELTKEILAEMGIILRSLKNDRRNGVNKSHFNEFDDDDEEQEMQEEGVYSSTNGPDVLTMQNLDESVGPINGDDMASPDLTDNPLKAHAARKFGQ